MEKNNHWLSSNADCSKNQQNIFFSTNITERLKSQAYRVKNEEFFKWYLERGKSKFNKWKLFLKTFVFPFWDKKCFEFWSITIFIHNYSSHIVTYRSFFTYRIWENKKRKYGPFCCQIPQEKTTKLNFEQGRLSARKGFRQDLYTWNINT